MKMSDVSIGLIVRIAYSKIGMLKVVRIEKPSGYIGLVSVNYPEFRCWAYSEELIKANEIYQKLYN